MTVVLTWIAVAIFFTGTMFMFGNFVLVVEGGVARIGRGIQCQLAALAVACVVLYGFGATFGIRQPWF